MHWHVLPLAKREEAPEVEPDEPDLPVVVARGDEEVAVQRHGVDGQRLAAVAGLGDLHLDALRGGLEGVLELVDEAAPCVPLDFRRDEPLLDGDVQVGLVLDQACVRPEETMCLPGQIDASTAPWLDQLGLVERVAYEPEGKWLDEDAARVSDKMKISLLGDVDLPTLECLVVERTDVAWLGRQKEDSMHLPQPLSGELQE